MHRSPVTVQTVSVGGGAQNSTNEKFSPVSFSNQCTSPGPTRALSGAVSRRASPSAYSSPEPVSTQKT